MALKQSVKKEHWMRVVKRQLQRRLYVQLQNPVSWSGLESVDDDKQHLYDDIADVTRSPDGNAFLEEVAEATRQVAEPVGASLL